MTNAGKLALVRIAATDERPEIILVEIALDDGAIITITDQGHNRLPDHIRRPAQQLIDLVLSED